MAATTTFAWAGKSRDGRIQKGETVASNKDEVMALLRKQGIIVTSLMPRARA
jgi:type II secretory pathway component PulF